MESSVRLAFITISVYGSDSGGQLTLFCLISGRFIHVFFKVITQVSILHHVRSIKKDTKRSSVLLLRFVNFELFFTKL